MIPDFQVMVFLRLIELSSDNIFAYILFKYKYLYIMGTSGNGSRKKNKTGQNIFKLAAKISKDENVCVI